MSAYKIMWLIVNFDLPTETKVERRRATQFRNMLIKEGFIMKQLSMYIQWFPNKTQAMVMSDRIGRLTPKKGYISVIPITDKQFSIAKNYIGTMEIDIEKPQSQLLLF